MIEHNLKMQPVKSTAPEYEHFLKALKKDLEAKLNRKRFPQKKYCPIWDNGYDYAIKEVLGTVK